MAKVIKLISKSAQITNIKFIYYKLSTLFWMIAYRGHDLDAVNDDC